MNVSGSWLWIVAIVLALVIGCNGAQYLFGSMGSHTILCSRCGAYISGRNRKHAQSEFALHMRQEHGEEWMP